MNLRNRVQLLRCGDVNSIYQYMPDFCRAWSLAGGEIREDVFPFWGIKKICGHLGFSFSSGMKFGKLLVCGSHKIESVAWPWCYFYEVVPVMWDLWPGVMDGFIRFLKRNRVKYAFCTSSQQVARINRELPDVCAVWMPEGLNVESYPMGPCLSQRRIDILEFGRRNEPLHKALIGHDFNRNVNHVYRKGPSLLFADLEDLKRAMRDAKIIVCYPQCDTKPQVAGDIETLTQRYWECMCSGALIVGRAPDELIRVCGYNPVITLGDNPAEQIEEIIMHVDEYQSFVARNRRCAEERAGWDLRVKMIRKVLGKG